MYSTNGQNAVTLLPSQIPSHTHIATATVTENPHSHFTSALDNTPTDLNASKPIAQSFGADSFLSYALKNANTAVADIGLTNSVKTNVDVAVSNSSVGGDGAHTNIPPVLACYYIMYIP